ncbi:LuxR C-terminal-related transcriptional regulator [Actinomycetospora sp. TBRC 11914]|uniref:helix-turn-helix transcriptional regulator n=1 Tax=Actinomycetospora sp. TBRC 11914 TaxID=2729387 RepID=UPI001B7D61A0|nr:LuxR C-terminal-related transcriptional regulator [Actinomycetospora sp. TBRC 11914]
MPVCLVAAPDADTGERVAHAVEAGFEQVRCVDLADLVATVARELPDLVVVAADVTASGAPGGAWTAIVEAVREAAPDLAVLVAGPPDIGREGEHRLAAAALDLGARGFLRSGEQVGPRPFSGSGRPVTAELSRRELDVLLGMTEGLSNSEIAAALELAEDTVKTHARRLFRKLGAGDRADAVARGFRQGILR